MNHGQGSAEDPGLGGGHAIVLFVAAYVLVSGGMLVRSLPRFGGPDPGLIGDPPERADVPHLRTARLFPRKLSDAVAQPRPTALRDAGALDAPRESSELYHRGLAAYADGRLDEAAGLWSAAAGLDSSNNRAHRALDRVRKELALSRRGATAIGVLANLSSLSWP